MAVGDVVFRNAEFAHERVTHFLHARERTVVETPRVAVARGKHGFVGHPVVLAAPQRDAFEKVDAARLEFAKLANVFAYECLERLREEFERLVEVFVDRLREEFPHARAIPSVGDLSDGLETLFFGGGQKVRADDDAKRDHHARNHRPVTEPEEKGRHDRAGGGRRKGREEPAAHDGEHARDAVDRAFAVPGAVRKRRAHRNHEGDVRG